MAGQNFRISVDNDEVEKAFGELERDAKTFSNVMEKLGKKLDEAFEVTSLDEFKRAYKAQEDVVKSLSVEYEKMLAKRREFGDKLDEMGNTDWALGEGARQYEKMSNEVTRIGNSLSESERILIRQRNNLDLIEEEFEKINSQSTTYLTQMRNVRNEMATLVDSDGNISSENRARYEELRTELGNLGTAYRRVQVEQRNVSNAGNAMIAGLTQGMQAIAGTFTLIQGISSAISGDSKDVAEVQRKLQQAMAITMGMQQLSTALHSTSQLRIGLVSRATDMLTTAQTRLATALNISATSAKALMGALTLGVSVGIGLLISAYNKYSSKLEETRKRQEEINQQYESQYSTVSRLIVKYNALRDQWIEIGNSLKDQKKFIADNKEEFKGLGKEITTVNDANTFLIDQTESYIKALLLRSEANANMALAEEAITKKLIANRQSQERLDDVTFWDKTRAFIAKRRLEVSGATKEEVDAISGVDFAKKASKELEEEAKKQDKIAKQHMTEMAKLAKESQDIFKQLGVDFDIKKPKKEKTSISYEEKEQKALEDQYIKFEKEKLEIEKLGVEDRLKLIEIERNERIASIEKEKKDLKEKYEKVDTEIFDKRIQQTKEFFDKKRQIEIENTDKLNAERLSKFASYSQREQKIREEYENLRKLAQKDKTIDVSLIDKAELEDLKKLKDEFNKDTVRTAQEIAIILDDISVMTAKELRDAIDKVNKELSKGITDPKELEAWQNQLEKLTSELKGKSPFMAFEQEVKKAAERMKKGDMSDIGAGIMAIGKATKDVMPELKELSSTIGNIFGQGAQSEVDGFIETLETLAEVGTGVGKVMAGDIVGGSLDLFNSIGSIIGKLKDVNEEHKEAIRLLKRQEENLKVQYAILVMQKNITESKNSIFGSDLYGSALISLREYNNALKLTHELLKGDRVPKNKYLLGQIINTKEIEAYKKDLLGLYDIEIVTGSRKSGWGFWKKQKDVYDSVLNVYDDLIDAEGRLNIARAESILQNRKMSDSDKEKFQNMIDSAKQAEAAYAEMEAYFSSIFGNLSNDLMDSVIEAFSKGENELHKFGNSAENMLKKLASDMVYYLAFSDIMEDAEEKIKKIRDSDLTEEEKLVKYSDAISDLNSNINNRLDYANSLLEMAEDVTGIDFSSDIEAPRASKGYQVTASQDSVDEVLGIARNMQMVGLNQEQELIKQTEILSTFGNGFISMQQELQGITSIALESMYYLRDIEKHTKTLNGFGEILTKIEKNTQ